MKYEKLVNELNRVFSESNCYYLDYLYNYERISKAEERKHRRRNDKALAEIADALWRLEELRK